MTSLHFLASLPDWFVHWGWIGLLICVGIIEPQKSPWRQRIATPVMLVAAVWMLYLFVVDIIPVLVSQFTSEAQVIWETVSRWREPFWSTGVPKWLVYCGWAVPLAIAALIQPKKSEFRKKIAQPMAAIGIMWFVVATVFGAVPAVINQISVAAGKAGAQLIWFPDPVGAIEINRLFLYYGWIGLFLAVGFVQPKKSKARDEIANVLLTLMFLWIALLVANLWMPLLRDVAQTYLGPLVLPFVAPSRALFGDWWDEVLVLTPWIVEAGRVLLNWKINSILNVVLNIWRFAVSIFFAYWMMGHLIDYPVFWFPLIAMLMIFGTFNFSSPDDWRKTAAQIAPRLLMRRAEEDQSTKLEVSGVIPLGLVLAYWAELRIPSGVLVEVYAALLAGLLAVVGFAAIIYTFSIDKIESSQVRRDLSDLTNRIYHRVGVSTAVVLASLAFLSALDVVFETKVRSPDEVLPVLAFAFATAGFVGSLEVTIKMFQQVVAISGGIQKGSRKVFVDESQPSPGRSVIDAGAAGLSKLKTYLEGEDHAVVQLEKVGLAELNRLRDCVLILPEIASPISEEKATAFREFVNRGDVLFVLVDSTDRERKDELLNVFGLAASALNFAEPDAVAAVVEDCPMAKEGNLGQFQMLAYHPVVFSSDRPMQPLATVPVKKEDGDIVPEPIAVMRKIGRGAVIFVGSIDHFNNENLDEHSHIEFLDAMMNYAFSLVAVDLRKAVVESATIEGVRGPQIGQLEDKAGLGEERPA